VNSSLSLICLHTTSATPTSTGAGAPGLAELELEHPVLRLASAASPMSSISRGTVLWWLLFHAFVTNCICFSQVVLRFFSGFNDW
jgi:hypothetical protein